MEALIDFHIKETFLVVLESTPYPMENTGQSSPTSGIQGDRHGK